MQSTMLSRLLRVAQEAVARRNTVADEEGTESGFTLIELMVVLLIMAILLAIAIPTFLGVKGGAQDRAAQSNLTNGLLSAKALYSSGGSYPVAASFTATMATQEPELTYTTAAVPTTGPTNQISFAISTDGNQIVLINYSPNNKGTCWALSDNNGASTALGGAPLGDEYASWAATTALPCTPASLVSPAPASFWNNSYPTVQLNP
jgi:type IV pilus assembly protein PilA